MTKLTLTWIGVALHSLFTRPNTVDSSMLRHRIVTWPTPGFHPTITRQCASWPILPVWPFTMDWNVDKSHEWILFFISPVLSHCSSYHMMSRACRTIALVGMNNITWTWIGVAIYHSCRWIRTIEASIHWCRVSTIPCLIFLTSTTCCSASRGVIPVRPLTITYLNFSSFKSLKWKGILKLTHANSQVGWPFTIIMTNNLICICTSGIEIEISVTCVPVSNSNVSKKHMWILCVCSQKAE